MDGGGSAVVGTVVADEGGGVGGEGGEGGGREGEGGCHSTAELKDESAVITRNASPADFSADFSVDSSADCAFLIGHDCAFLIGHRITTGASPCGWWPTTTARTCGEVRASW